MKNYGVILAIAAKLLVALPLIAQQGWTQQQLPPVPERLFHNEDLIIAPVLLVSPLLSYDWPIVRP
jgi:Sec-independent protein secretion pathway component TatC